MRGIMPTVSSEVKLERIVEELESVYRNTNDFLGLRMLGNFYELSAERHRSSDVSRWVVIDWFAKAAETYKAALSAYQSQVEIQIPSFENYLRQRIGEVETLVGLIRPYGLRPVPVVAEAPELVTVGIG